MSENPSPAPGSGFNTGYSSTKTRFNQLRVPGTGSGPDPESPVAVDRYQDFVAAGAGGVPGMIMVEWKPVEALLVNAVQQFVDPFGHARPIVEEIVDAVQHVGDGLHLHGVDQLRNRGGVDVAATVLDPGAAPCFGGFTGAGWR